MTSHKKPTAGFWITVSLVAALVAYPLSFGPACWVLARDNSRSQTHRSIEAIYRPLFWVIVNGPAWASVPLDQYSSLWM